METRNVKGQGQTMLNGAMILVVATLIVKIIGAIYKIPLTALIGAEGRGYFSSAYELYTPVYAISMAGLPVAVSKMVSENVSLGRYRDARMIFRLAMRLFFIVGVVGTLVLVLIAIPYVFLAHSVENLWSILAIAPSIFFCCMMSTYRGYYEGMRNMTPTAISQVIEASGKLVLGIFFAKFVKSYGLKRYAAGLSVFGKMCETEAQALSRIYPYAAAAAVLSITIGTIAALLFLAVLYRVKGDQFTREMLVNSPRPRHPEKVVKMMITIAIPMVISALIMNVTNLIDNFTIRTRLTQVVLNNLDYFKTRFAASLQASQTMDDKIPTYLFGCYFSALDFKNMITSITMTLGVSAIPALAAARALKQNKEVASTINSVIRVCMLVAAPAGFGIAVLSEPILRLLYASTDSADMIPIAAPIMAIYGFVTFIMALSTPLTNVLQALGRADIPAKVIAAGAITKVICNFIFVGIPKFNIYGATIGTIVCYLIIITLNVYFTIKVSGCRIRFLSAIVKPLLCSAVCAFSAYAAQAVFSHILTFGKATSRLNGYNVSTLLAVGIAVLVYAACLLVSKSISREDVIMLPKGKKIAKVLEKYDFLG